MTNNQTQYSLSDCLFYRSNNLGDCGGRVEKHTLKVSNGIHKWAEGDVVVCENCFNNQHRMNQVHIWEVQVGKDNGSYKSKYSFVSPGPNNSRAWLYYSSINIGNGYKKRLRRDGVVLARQFS